MTSAEASAIVSCLSVPRVGTYKAACTPASGEDPHVAALRLYRWNVEVSAAFMAPIHLCEVAIRNAVSEALTAVYGPQWPWSASLRQALPTTTPPNYSPKRDLVKVAQNYATTGKVIPELKFVFWEKMFTSRHDNRLWNPHLRTVLPNLDPNKPIKMLRGEIRASLGEIRILRNRIAHHEPIFGRGLADDLDRLRGLVGHRSSEMRDWLNAVESVTSLMAAKP